MLIEEPIAGVQDEAGGAQVSLVIVNADDWGRDCETTARTLDCMLAGSVSSVSAMVFMQDAERAAGLAREHDIDAGLHLNLTTPFDAPQCPRGLLADQRRIARFLGSYRLAPLLFHPGLASAFRSIVEAQWEEFERLYGGSPARIDGHHHMHLAANVVLQKLLPGGTMVRRNLSFGEGEKNRMNRSYRRWQDGLLARRHGMTDYFFDLAPLEAGRLGRMAALGREHSVEIEAHPVVREQYEFLMRGGLAAICPDVKIARGYRCSR